MLNKRYPKKELKCKVCGVVRFIAASNYARDLKLTQMCKVCKNTQALQNDIYQNETVDVPCEVCGDIRHVKRKKLHRNIKRCKKCAAVDPGIIKLKQDNFAKSIEEKYNISVEEFYEQNLQKARGIFQQKYNVTSPFHSGDIQNKCIEACMERYGTPYYTGPYGKMEKSILDLLTSLGVECVSQYVMPSGKSLDIYVPSKSLAIEYNGLYWHNEKSPNPRLKPYHYNKMKEANSLGIRLITIFEDEWLNRKDQVLNFIKSALGLHTTTVFARKCDIKEITKTEANDFLKATHIQGSAVSTIKAWGLFYQEKLVAVMTFGKHHRQGQEKSVILTRLSYLDGFNIPGGASRLLKHGLAWAKQNCYEKLVSWSDNRWSQGAVYEKLGFIFEEELGPDYSYVNSKHTGKLRLSKQSQKKSAVGCPKEITEKVWAEKNGLARIWDCGKKRWVIHIV